MGYLRSTLGDNLAFFGYLLEIDLDYHGLESDLICWVYLPLGDRTHFALVGMSDAADQELNLLFNGDRRHSGFESLN